MMTNGRLPIPPHKPSGGNNFYCRSGITEEEAQQIRDTPTDMSQTSSLIKEIHIYLNRVKMIPMNGTENGEYLDLCTGCLENGTYREKLVLFLMDRYFTIPMARGELREILKKGYDDKFKKRVQRLVLMDMISRLPGINDLFRIIGRVISNERLDTFDELDDESEDEEI